MPRPPVGPDRRSGGLRPLAPAPGAAACSGRRRRRLGVALLAPRPDIKWWHAAIGVGGFGLLLTVDRPVQDFAQDHRGHTTDDIANAFRHWGEPEAFVTASLGLLGAGLLTGNRA